MGTCLWDFWFPCGIHDLYKWFTSVNRGTPKTPQGALCGIGLQPSMHAKNIFWIFFGLAWASTFSEALIGDSNLMKTDI